MLQIDIEAHEETELVFVLSCEISSHCTGQLMSKLELLIRQAATAKPRRKQHALLGDACSLNV